MKAELILIPYPDEQIELIIQFFANELLPYSIESMDTSVLNNNEDDIEKTISAAIDDNDLVVIAGKSNPGPLISKFFNIDAVVNSNSLQRVNEYYKNIELPLPKEINNLALVPRGAKVVINDHGPLSAFFFEKDNKKIIFMPGRPREIFPMFNEVAKNLIDKDSKEVIYTSTVGAFGLSETLLTARLSDILSGANPRVNVYSKNGEALFQIVSMGASIEAAKEIATPVIQAIVDRLGQNCYGIDAGSLQKAVVSALYENHLSLCIAEDDTVFRLATTIKQIPKSADVLKRSVLAGTRVAKKQTLGITEEEFESIERVSPEMARKMAVNVRKVGRADIGFAITEIKTEAIKDDDGNDKDIFVVFTALADEKRIWTKRVEKDVLGIEGEEIQIVFNAVYYSLDLMRRYVDALPTVMAGGEQIEEDVSLVISEDEPKETVPVLVPKKSIFSKLFPTKRDPTSEKVRKISILLVILFLLGVIFYAFFYDVFFAQKSDGLYNPPEKAIVQKDGFVDTMAGNNSAGNMLEEFTQLFSENDAISGWISIDNTNISQPVMRDVNNGYYKKHDFYHSESVSGVPYFVNAENIEYITSASTLAILGNNTRDGNMFSDIAKYYEENFLLEHSVIEMNTIYNRAKWKIFSVMVIPEPDSAQGFFDYSISEFGSEEENEEFISNVKALSIYDVPNNTVDVEASDSLLFVATNFEEEINKENAQIVVAARKVRQGEDEDHSMDFVKYKDLFEKESTQWLDLIFPSGETSVEKRSAKLTNSSGTVTLKDLGFATKYSTHSISSNSNRSTPSTNKDQTVTTNKGGGTNDVIKPTTPSGNSGGDENSNDDAPGSGSNNETPLPPPRPSPSIPAPNLPSPIIVQKYGSSEKVLTSQVSVIGQEGYSNTKNDWLEIISKLVNMEIGYSSFSDEAIKAQAIAAYTYILYNKKADVTGYDSAPARIKNLVNSVLGEKILIGSTPINAMYFASAPGVTLDNANHFGSSRSYLKAVESKYDDWSMSSVGSSNDSTYTTTSQSAFSSLLSKRAPSTVYFDGTFAVTARDPYGKYVLKTNAYYKSGGTKIYLTGKQIREFSSYAIRSTAFTVTGNQTSLTLNVTGYGHGVGMSQHGANGYAKMAGWNYKQILAHYYSFKTSGASIYFASSWS